MTDDAISELHHNDRLVGWSLTALSAQKGYIVQFTCPVEIKVC